MTTDYNDSLTPEEIEALNDSLDDEVFNEDEKLKEVKENEGEKKGKEESVDTNNVDEQKQEVAEEDIKKPILVADSTDGVEDQLKDIEARKETLLDQFDNGDLTARDYQKQLDALMKEERKIERQVHESELAAKLESQRMQNEWSSTCNAFLAQHTIYKENTRLFSLLDSEVKQLATKPETSNWTGQQFLDAAHKNLQEAFNFGDKKADEGKKQQVSLPPNLSRIPSAEIESTEGGRFAALERLATSDPLAYEEAISKMSDSERKAYLSQ